MKITGRSHTTYSTPGGQEFDTAEEAIRQTKVEAIAEVLRRHQRTLIGRHEFATDELHMIAERILSCEAHLKEVFAVYVGTSWVPAPEAVIPPVGPELTTGELMEIADMEDAQAAVDNIPF